MQIRQQFKPVPVHGGECAASLVGRLQLRRRGERTVRGPPLTMPLGPCSSSTDCLVCWALSDQPSCLCTPLAAQLYAHERCVPAAHAARGPSAAAQRSSRPFTADGAKLTTEILLRVFLFYFLGHKVYGRAGGLLGRGVDIDLFLALELLVRSLLTCFCISNSLRFRTPFFPKRS